MTMVRGRKIRTALRTKQIAEFIAVTTWKKEETKIVKYSHKTYFSFVLIVQGRIG